jgi:hypothetical protein
MLLDKKSWPVVPLAGIAVTTHIVFPSEAVFCVDPRDMCAPIEPPMSDEHC